MDMSFTGENDGLDVALEIQEFSHVPDFPVIGEKSNHFMIDR